MFLSATVAATHWVLVLNISRCMGEPTTTSLWDFPQFSLVAHLASVLLQVHASPTASILNVSICPLTACYTFLLFQPLGVDMAHVIAIQCPAVKTILVYPVL